MTRPLVIGHRGALAVAPENSIEGFRAALDAGADGVELDVRFTADGVPVVLHDPTLDRTTALSGRIDRLHSTALVRAGKGSVPLLALALETLVEARIVNLEIKQRSLHPKTGQAGIERVIELVRQRGPGAILLSSFDETIVSELVRLAGRERTGLLARRGLLRPVTAALRLGAGALVLSIAQLRARRTERARAAGLRVWAYPVRAEAEWNLAVRAGCDAVIGDDPGMLVRWRGRSHRSG